MVAVIIIGAMLQTVDKKTPVEYGCTCCMSERVSSVKRPANNKVIRLFDLGLKSHPKDRGSGGSILRSLDWCSS